MKGYGATVVDCEPILAAREATTHDIVQKTGATLHQIYSIRSTTWMTRRASENADRSETSGLP